MLSYYTKLKKLFPTCSDEIGEFRRLRDIVRRIPMAPFFEPKVCVEITNDGRRTTGKLVSVDSATLTSWAAHVSNAVRARMRTFEDAILEQLASKRVLPAMVLSRSHMEAAGLAAFALGLLADGKWEALESIIAKTLFGTSFSRHRDIPYVVDFAGISAVDTIEIRQMYEALDHFAESTGELVTHRFRAQYAMLCEYAHPNLGGTRSFFRVLEERPDGWVLKYSQRESVKQSDVRAVLGVTLETMRVGYAATLLLINGKFEESPKGTVYIKPSEEHGQWIWENIVNRPGSREAAQTGLP